IKLSIERPQFGVKEESNQWKFFLPPYFRSNSPPESVIDDLLCLLNNFHCFLPTSRHLLALVFLKDQEVLAVIDTNASISAINGEFLDIHFPEVDIKEEVENCLVAANPN